MAAGFGRMLALKANFEQKKRTSRVRMSDKICTNSQPVPIREPANKYDSKKWLSTAPRAADCAVLRLWPVQAGPAGIRGSGNGERVHS